MAPRDRSSQIKKLKVIKGEGQTPASEEEAEAKLKVEGYDSFRWHDVPGATYPIHRHLRDECIWVLTGSICFAIEGEIYELQAGDRLYLPARIPHHAYVPDNQSVTYIVGQRNNRLLSSSKKA